MWASGHGSYMKRAAHGYEATRKAVMGIREVLAKELNLAPLWNPFYWLPRILISLTST